MGEYAKLSLTGKIPFAIKTQSLKSKVVPVLLLKKTLHQTVWEGEPHSFFTSRKQVICFTPRKKVPGTN
jgi:hypothetical protein